MIIQRYIGLKVTITDSGAAPGREASCRMDYGADAEDGILRVTTRFGFVINVTRSFVTAVRTIGTPARILNQARHGSVSTTPMAGIDVRPCRPSATGRRGGASVNRNRGTCVRR